MNDGFDEETASSRKTAGNMSLQREQSLHPALYRQLPRYSNIQMILPAHLMATD